MRSVAPRQPDGVDRGAQVAAHQGEVAGLDRHVGAGAHRHAEVGLGERGGVVDAVADHGDDAGPRACSRRMTSTLSGGEHLGDRPRRCPTWAATSRAARSLSPVSSTGRSPSSRSPAIASAEVGLTVSATTRTARAAPSQPTKTGVRPAASAASRAATQCVVEVQRPVGEEPLATGDDGVTVDDALHAEALDVGERLDRYQVDAARSRAPARDRLRDRVLGGVLERAGETAVRRSVVVVAGGDDVDERHASRW